MVIIEYQSSGSAVTFQLDVSPSQDHESTAEATAHPVEQGADSSDHVHLKPRTLAVGGFFSDFMIDGPAQPGHAQEAFDLLYQIQQARQLLRVYTSQGVYENMVLEGLKSSKTSANSKGAIQVSLSFKQIRVATTRTVQVQTSTPKGRIKDSSGHKTSQATTPPETATSVLSHSFHAIFGGTPTGAQ